MSLLPDPTPQASALDQADYGEVFTRRWVVETILDLCGFTTDRDLAEMTAIEPACGTGAFVVPMIERLAESATRHERDLATAKDALMAVDLLPSSVSASREAATRALLSTGLDDKTAARLANHWIRQGDFLLEPPASESTDFVVGNPPYIRLEAMPPALSNAYREACPTMAGRSDIYIGFYERGLRTLRKEGVLGFICADRWMRNAYGARLRELISTDWSVEVVMTMTGVDAFEEEVDAYPAITVLRRGAQTRGPLVVDTDPDFGKGDARKVVKAAADRASASSSKRFRAARLPQWFSGRSGWPHGSPSTLAAIADMESRLPALENEASGTRVGIGLATGADRVFILTNPHCVEPERALPMALVRDIASGNVEWSGHYLVNPWDSDGLVDLAAWPKLESYLTMHKAVLSKRHTAKSGRWHKTIDRVIEGLSARQKLYLPDFKETLFPVLDAGTTYPHHNLYWITSDDWDLEVLGGILLSEIANLFIGAYSVKMRGGYLRFQAQYLRRIRVPILDQVDAQSQEALRKAFRTRNRAAATNACLPLYGLTAVPG
jgi:adenine-specific DNA-methyltransferase